MGAVSSQPEIPNDIPPENIYQKVTVPLPFRYDSDNGGRNSDIGTLYIATE